ncbi:asparagine synthase-related protein [Croceicoccus naphthovorans]|nr:asparagine synthase-related protein [Croceicoccus naphthovorans]MBB3989259.1 asparagine synthase (glutamine-hydrolyzing) [Croceicoccus naphthovorans]
MPWRPAHSQSTGDVLFGGWIDNESDLRERLGANARHIASGDNAALYAAALDCFGGDADRHVVGHYAAAAWHEGRGEVRLVRSPWSAPPLHYFRDAAAFGAASTVPALHACGLEYRLNPRKFADNLFFNLTEEQGWFENAFEVKPGTVVLLSAEAIHRHRFHDPLEPRETIRLPRRADYVDAVDALLEDAVRSTLRGTHRPAMQLTGGLDSTNVAARVLRVLPPEQPLDSFTFGPHREWQGSTADRFFASERDGVEAFARMHPRVRTHFTDNADGDFDTGLDQMFQAIGIAPISMLNPAPLHGVYAMASEARCDVMLSAGMGNCTFSSMGEWASVEYFQQLRLIQLYRLLRDSPIRQTSIPRFFLSKSIKPLLPLALQRNWHRMRGIATPETALTMVPLRQEAMDRFDTEGRARAAGILSDTATHHGRRQNLVNIFARGDMNAGDQELAFRQIYGIPGRDIASYRPLFEFCSACPTDAFIHDGQERWLARELGRGQIPESIRTEYRTGRPSSDWHFRLKRRLPQLREEIQAASKEPFLAEIIDFPEVIRRIEQFPSEPRFTQFETLAFQMGLPRVIMAVRYHRYVKSRQSG